MEASRRPNSPSLICYRSTLLLHSILTLDSFALVLSITSKVKGLLLLCAEWVMMVMMVMMLNGNAFNPYITVNECGLPTQQPFGNYKSQVKTLCLPPNCNSAVDCICSHSFETKHWYIPGSSFCTFLIISLGGCVRIYITVIYSE